MRPQFEHVAKPSTRDAARTSCITSAGKKLRPDPPRLSNGSSPYHANKGMTPPSLSQPFNSHASHERSRRTVPDRLSLAHPETAENSVHVAPSMALASEASRAQRLQEPPRPVRAPLDGTGAQGQEGERGRGGADHTTDPTRARAEVVSQVQGHVAGTHELVCRSKKTRARRMSEQDVQSRDGLSGVREVNKEMEEVTVNMALTLRRGSYKSGSFRRSRSGETNDFRLSSYSFCVRGWSLWGGFFRGGFGGRWTTGPPPRRFEATFLHRLHHRVEDTERAHHAPVEARRFQGGRDSSGTRRGQEQGRPLLSIH